MRNFVIIGSPKLLICGHAMCVGESITVKGKARGAEIVYLDSLNIYNTDVIKRIVRSNPKRKTYDLVNGPYKYLQCIYYTKIVVQTARGRIRRELLRGEVIEALSLGADYLFYNRMSKGLSKFEKVEKTELVPYARRLR